jgi:hypothetical protein
VGYRRVAARLAHTEHMTGVVAAAHARQSTVVDVFLASPANPDTRALCTLQCRDRRHLPTSHLMSTTIAMIVPPPA